MRTIGKPLVLTVVAATILCAAEGAKQPMIGQAAPSFRLQGLDGKALALAELRGKFVVLHFGTGW